FRRVLFRSPGLNHRHHNRRPKKPGTQHPGLSTQDLGPTTELMLPSTSLPLLLSGATLSEADAESLFEALLSGAYDDAQIAAVLTLIQSRGVTVDELAGAARVMRRHVAPVPCPADDSAVVIDTCGTGGAPKTFNVSTAAAFVVAAARP